MIAAHFGVVHQLHNNAPIAFSRSLLETECADYEGLFAVNLWGVIHGTNVPAAAVASGHEHRVNAR